MRCWSAAACSPFDTDRRHDGSVVVHGEGHAALDRPVHRADVVAARLDPGGPRAHRGSRDVLAGAIGVRAVGGNGCPVPKLSRCQSPQKNAWAEKHEGTTRRAAARSSLASLTRNRRLTAPLAAQPTLHESWSTTRSADGPPSLSRGSARHPRLAGRPARLSHRAGKTPLKIRAKAIKGVDSCFVARLDDPEPQRRRNHPRDQVSGLPAGNCRRDPVSVKTNRAASSWS